MTKLFVSTIKQLFRDTEAVFWSLVFPALFIIIFSFFTFGDSINSRVVLIDQTGGAADELISNLQHNAGIGVIKEDSSIEEAKIALESSEQYTFEYFDEENGDFYTQKGKVNVVMVTSLTDEGKLKLDLYYNEAEETQASPSGILVSAITSMTNEQLIAESGIEKNIAIERTGISVNEFDYYDAIVPGIIGMGVMQSGIIGIASGIATYKEKRILKRLSATPLPVWKFLLSQIIAHLLLSVVQIIIMIILAKYLLNANIYGSIPLMFALAFAGNFVFLSLGFIAAAFSNTARAAEGLAQVFTTPMMFLSGVFFERDGLPGVVKIVADFLPLSPLLDAMRKVSLYNQGLADMQNELLILAIWTAVAVVIAARVFKFREE